MSAEQPDLAALAKPMSSGSKQAEPPSKPSKSTKPASHQAEQRPSGARWSDRNARGNIYLPPSLREAASEQAAARGLSFSGYVRGLIEADLEA